MAEIKGKALSLLFYLWGVEGVCFNAENCAKKVLVVYVMLWLVSES